MRFLKIGTRVFSENKIVQIETADGNGEVFFTSGPSLRLPEGDVDELLEFIEVEDLASRRQAADQSLNELLQSVKGTPLPLEGEPREELGRMS